MGQQRRVNIKRRRRADYLKRKKEQAKLGGIAQKKSAPKKPAASAEPKAPKKTAAAKKAAKKAPAKKAAKKAGKVDTDKSLEEAPQTTAPAALGAEEAEGVEKAAEGTAEAAEAIDKDAPQPAEEE